jgi:transcriptional regulator with XRE-family HTH domain
MRLAEIGFRLRQLRLARGLTQAHLAQSAGVSRSTLNAFENGLVKDLGIAKVLAIAQVLGATLDVVPVPRRATRDHLSLATTAANVGFRSPITESDLLRALLTGKVPSKGRPNFRRLLGDSPPEVIRGLLEQLGAWAPPGRLARNLERLARELDITPERVAAWTKIA